MENLPVSVVIVARNAEKTIDDCLNSVHRNTPAETIVVDGNSSDRTVEIARRYTQKIYSDEGKGLNYARQLGAEMATQEYLAYIDSDVILTEGALNRMLTEFQGSEYVSMIAQQAPDMKCCGYWEWAQYQHNQLRSWGGHLNTLACLFRRETILKYGFDLSARGLDRRLDDLDLEIRLRREGYKFGISPAIIYIRYIADLKSLIRYRFFLGRVGVRYIRKYGPWQAGLWPPLATAYWLGFCLIKGKLRLIPYFIIDGTAKTAGMVVGFFELIGEALGKNQY